MIETHEQLAHHTTLKVGGAAEYFTVVTTEAELVSAVDWAKAHAAPITVLGGGSNVLVSDEGVRGLVIKNAIAGFSVTTSADTILVTVGAGEVFDDVVAKAVEAGWWGLENLSHIPGSVGATPVQNVGAYGVEVKDVIASVRVFDTAVMKFKMLSPTDCLFGYRDSVFKKPTGQHYVITSVTFRLSCTSTPHLSYRDLAEYFADKNPTLAEIREAVIAIRSRKFPDWQVVGTAGSFFKNPTITTEAFARLSAKYEGIPSYVVSDHLVKVPLGWLLDKALNLKGVQDGPVGTYEGQALVLVNRGGATASDIARFAEKIVDAVKTETGIDIEWEVTRW